MTLVTIAVFFLLRIPFYAVNKSLREVAQSAYRRIDYLGALTLTTSVTTFIIALTLATSTSEDAYTWSDPLVLGLLAISVVFFILLLCVEQWFASEPILPLRLMAQPTPALIALNNLLLMMQTFATVGGRLDDVR